MKKKRCFLIFVFLFYLVGSSSLTVIEYGKTAELNTTKVLVLTVLTLMGTGISFWIIYKLSCLLVFFVSGKRDEDYVLVFSLVISNIIRAFAQFITRINECAFFCEEILTQFVFTATLTCIFCIAAKNLSIGRKMIIILIALTVDQIGVLIEHVVNVS